MSSQKTLAGLALKLTVGHTLSSEGKLRSCFHGICRFIVPAAVFGTDIQTQVQPGQSETPPVLVKLTSVLEAQAKQTGNWLCLKYPWGHIRNYSH